MTKRRDVSVIFNKFHDAQRVDEQDLDTEQNRNIDTDASIIQNHIGTGVLLENPIQLVLFDSNDLSSTQASLLAANKFDGYGLDPQNQPSDSNYGNQLEVELTDSLAIGRFSVKVAIIGLDFNGNLQMDRFYFYRNEKQVTSKHYKKILSILTNDFKGNNNCSRQLGGRFVIKEVCSFQLSKDPIMIAQDVEPDIFWRDFKVADTSFDLSTTLQIAIGSEYNVDDLNINTTFSSVKEIEPNDVTTQYIQKFKTTTDNIQKITLLLGVNKDSAVAEKDWFGWDGDIVVSIYALQTTVSCPTDIIPNLAIDFEPEKTPLAQVSFNMTSLEKAGYIFNDVLQPVDFVFSNTKLGSGKTSSLTVDNYYALSFKRSGASGTGTLFLGIGSNKLDNSVFSVFSGVWTDVTEEDMWFQVWTDAAKIADGKGYDNGHGIQYDKVILDDVIGTNVDNQINAKTFVNTGSFGLNIGVLQAVPFESVKIQDERSGNDINARQKYVPSFSFVTESGLDDLKQVSNPFIIGVLSDVNPKKIPTLEKTQIYPGLAKNNEFTIINPDSDLLSQNLVGSNLIPNIDNCCDAFKIVKALLCTDGYGDLDNDGDVDTDDIALASSLLGESLFYNSTQQKIIDGFFTTLDIIKADVDGDGYVTANDVDLITKFANKTINSFAVGATFQHLVLTVQQQSGRYDGFYSCYDGYVFLDDGYGSQPTLALNLDSLEQKYDGYTSDPTINNDIVFSTVPFKTVTYKIEPQPFWQPYFIHENSNASKVQAIFTENSALNDTCLENTLSYCKDISNNELNIDPGRNDFYIGDGNIILDHKAAILNEDGSNYSVDIEIGTVILQFPELILENAVIDVFNKLIADHGGGLTSAKFPAMKYSDCTFVQPGDLVLGRVKITASIQSIVKNAEAYSSDDGYGILIQDPELGLYLDQETGILTVTAADLKENKLMLPLVTRVLITVYLKKAGWKQNFTIVKSSQIAGLLS